MKQHNPDNLTPAQIALIPGLRLLDEDESRVDRPMPPLPQIFCWRNGIGWVPGYSGRSECYTSATTLTRAELRAARGLPPESDTAKPSPFVTVTGADEHTDIGMLAKLDAEIGLLYTATPEGRTRYPSRRWIIEAARRLPRVAIHICGSAAREELRNGYAGDLIEHAQRIQVNGRLRVEEVEAICALYPTKTIITQHTPQNEKLPAAQAKNHAILIDGSGGRGITPDGWLRIADTQKAVGFAGGLCAENMSESLDKIESAAADGWWIDMEGKLRVNDYFSIERAREAVNAFHARMNNPDTAQLDARAREVIADAPRADPIMTVEEIHEEISALQSEVADLKHERDQYFKALQFNREVLSSVADILGIEDPRLESFTKHVQEFKNQVVK